MDREKEALECLEALLEVEQGLTDWEVERIDEWSRRQRPLTGKQINKIFEIYDQHC